MVNFCAIVGCGSRSGRDKGVSFYRLPAEVTHQGERTLELSTKRRDLWMARINRANFKPSEHTVFALNILLEVSTEYTLSH